MMGIGAGGMLPGSKTLKPVARITARAPSLCSSCMNSRPDMERNRLLKVRSCSRSRPLCSSSRQRSRRFVSRVGGSFGLRNSRGMGSKLSRTADTFKARARARVRAMRA